VLNSGSIAYVEHGSFRYATGRVNQRRGFSERLFIAIA
jgi:hypothetical protein